MYPTTSNGLNYENEDAVYFFTPAFAPLDCFSAHVVDIWGITFPTAEHAYQWRKFSEINPDISFQIFSAPSAHLAKEIANSNVEFIRPTWYDIRVDIMEQILLAKAKQHADVRDALHRTGQKRIIENAPDDSFWSIGPAGDGLNMVGKLWMKIRHII